jgi:hypothetical protein
MELSISDDKTNELLTEVMIELLRTKRDLIRDILMEALEEVGLANAIAEGRKNEFVSEDEVFQTVMRQDALEISSPYAINSTGARP